MKGFPHEVLGLFDRVQPPHSLAPSEQLAAHPTVLLQTENPFCVVYCALCWKCTVARHINKVSPVVFASCSRIVLETR